MPASARISSISSSNSPARASHGPGAQLAPARSLHAPGIGQRERALALDASQAFDQFGMSSMRADRAQHGLGTGFICDIFVTAKARGIGFGWNADRLPPCGRCGAGVARIGAKCRVCSLPDVDNPPPGSSGSSPGGGRATLRLAADRKRLQIELAVDAKGLDKTGVNGLIDASQGVRDKMER